MTNKRFRSRGKCERMRSKNATKDQPPNKKGGGAPRSAPTGAASTSEAARTLSPAFPLREDRGPGLALDLKKWSGRARLSAPHRGIRGFFGLGSAQAALPGTTGYKREDPLRHPCSEHLAVRHAPA